VNLLFYCCASGLCKFYDFNLYFMFIISHRARIVGPHQLVHDIAKVIKRMVYLIQQQNGTNGPRYQSNLGYYMWQTQQN